MSVSELRLSLMIFLTVCFVLIPRVKKNRVAEMKCPSVLLEFDDFFICMLHFDCPGRQKNGDLFVYEYLQGEYKPKWIAFNCLKKVVFTSHKHVFSGIVKYLANGFNMILYSWR